MAAIGAVGRYRSPSFSDNAILEEAVGIIGWQVLCNTEEDALSFVRAQFRDIYEGLRKGALRDANVEPLLNAHRERRERMNRQESIGKLVEGSFTKPVKG